MAMRTVGSALILLSVFGIAPPLSAQPFDKSIYIGAGGLVSELEPRVNDSGFEITESISGGGQLFAGIDLARYFSVEGYYRFLGESELARETDSGAIQYQTAGISGLLYVYSSQGFRGLKNRSGLMLYGRAGAGYLDNSSDEIDFDRSQATHIAAGAGVEYGFRNGFALRAEFLNHDVDARDISFNLVKRFGQAREVNITPQPTVPETPAIAESSQLASQNGTTLLETPPPPPPAPIWDTDGDGVLDRDDRCQNTESGLIVDETGCAFSGVQEGLTFATGSAELTVEATRVLEEVARSLAANPTVEIVVESHTDNLGSAQINMNISRRRAAAVVRYLADFGGVDLSRMTSVGFGEGRPTQTNRTASGRQANRRVEITVK